MKRVTVSLFAVVLLLAGAAQAEELIQGSMVRLGSGAQTTFLKVQLDRYSTDEERAQWREAFKAGGQEALVAKWQEENPRLGTMSMTQSLGYHIRAAISVPTEKGRKIFLATDRRISGFEVLNASQSQDYPIGWLQFEVDAEGKGEGQVVGAAELVVENDRLTIKSYGTQPVRVMNVSVRAAK